MKNVCCLILLLLFSQLVSAQEQSVKDSTKNLRILPLPVIFFTPESNWGFGAGMVGQFTINRATEDNFSSQITPGGAYTLNKQILLYFPYQLFWKNNDFFVKGEVGYYDYFFPFYGIGNNSLEEDLENFSVSFPRLEGNFNYKVLPNLYVGPNWWFENFNITEVETDGILDQQEIVGKDGGLVSGIGIHLLYDVRDNVYQPSKGRYLRLTNLFHNEDVISDFTFQYHYFEYGEFIPLNEKLIWALSAGSFLSFGDVPFHRLPQLGGTKYARGYIRGRYRDQHYSWAQTEMRFRIWKNIGGVAFLTSNLIYNNQEANFSNLRNTYGAGLRVQVNEEGATLRVDYGFNRETSGFYITVGEAF